MLSDVVSLSATFKIRGLGSTKNGNMCGKHGSRICNQAGNRESARTLLNSTVSIMIQLTGRTCKKNIVAQSNDSSTRESTRT